jgi:Skp family chaperone for outer membrane proteins
MRSFFLVLLSGIFLFLFTSAPVFAQPAAKATVDRECSKCHNTKRIYSASKDAVAWNKTLEKMMKKGAAIKPEEKDAVLKFLNTLNK